MGADSAIEWTDHTFNAWVGCTKLSAACDFCYAETWAKRAGHPELWEGERRRTSEANWRQPLRWNVDAPKTGKRRVFCCSLADVFDNRVNPQWRADLFDLIRKTSNLEWQLLTKRPQNITKMCETAGGLPVNAALGTTVENQEQAETRIEHLLRAASKLNPLYTFVSAEPLLGPVNLRRVMCGTPPKPVNVLGGRGSCPSAHDENGYATFLVSDGVDWVIAGGESGPGSRPMHPQWAREIQIACETHRTPFLFKQWGEWHPHKVIAGGDLGGDVRAGRVRIVHPTGQTDVEVSEATGGRNTIPGSRYMARVGKKAAGRLLDGVEHNGFPGVRT